MTYDKILASENENFIFHHHHHQNANFLKANSSKLLLSDSQQNGATTTANSSKFEKQPDQSKLSNGVHVNTTSSSSKVRTSKISHHRVCQN